MILSRRRLVQLAGVGAGAAMFPLEVLAGPAIPNDRALLLIQLAGGNDGLNTLAPLSDAQYSKMRPTVGLKADETIDIGGPVAMHSGLTALMPAFKEGRLALMQGVGYPQPNRSHFESIAVWQSGELKPRTPLGWIGRALEASSLGTFSLTSIGGGGSSPTLWTAKRPPAVLGSLDAFAAKNDNRNPGDGPALLKALNDIYAQPEGPDPVLGSIRRVGHAGPASSDELRRTVNSYVTKTVYPRGGFGDQLKLAVEMLSAPLGVRVAHVVLSGFDTHANQKRQHQTLLTSLAEGIAAVLDDAQEHGLADRLVVMTYSEFGRRVGENGSGGTDHGSASVMMLAGNKVAGGLFGTPPDLAHLDQGDVPSTTDFRSVYGAVLTEWLGLQVDPGLKWPGAVPKLLRTSG